MPTAELRKRRYPHVSTMRGDVALAAEMSLQLTNLAGLYDGVDRMGSTT
jgi:hypothetical protein